MNRWLCIGGTIMVVIYFFVLRINSLQNTNEPEIGPCFSIPNKELFYTEKGGGGNKMSVSEKSGS